jgi:hypothetical protein
MKFIFADSLDCVDPNYDFLTDRFGPNREPQLGDVYPHELLGSPPYDGILVSRAIVGGGPISGKYTQAQRMRFLRDGARKFLRYDEKNHPDSFIFGDSGAFSYSKMKEPPYVSEEILDYYSDGGFTHGCSVDHIIFDFVDDEKVNDLSSERAAENNNRFEITLRNAEEFLQLSQRMGNHFTPLGVVQGWSPKSMAKAAGRLVRMGYNYLAVGGMVPLQSPQIMAALSSIRSAVGDEVRLHVLGFAKAEEISSFGKFNITSFDSTSPLLRSFKDSRRNYYDFNEGDGISYYSAIRVPQSTENKILKYLSAEGIYRQEDLQIREANALDALREYDDARITKEDVLQAVMDYSTPLLIGRDTNLTPKELVKLSVLRQRYDHTLTDMPWKKCLCEVCKSIGIEVMVFRASNRNKRRGFHNLYAYHRHIKSIQGNIRA